MLCFILLYFIVKRFLLRVENNLKPLSSDFYFFCKNPLLSEFQRKDPLLRYAMFYSTSFHCKKISTTCEELFKTFCYNIFCVVSALKVYYPLPLHNLQPLSHPTVSEPQRCANAPSSPTYPPCPYTLYPVTATLNRYLPLQFCFSFSLVHESVDHHIAKLCIVVNFYTTPHFAYSVWISCMAFKMSLPVNKFQRKELLLRHATFYSTLFHCKRVSVTCEILFKTFCHKTIFVVSGIKMYYPLPLDNLQPFNHPTVSEPQRCASAPSTPTHPPCPYTLSSCHNHPEPPLSPPIFVSPLTYFTKVLTTRSKSLAMFSFFHIMSPFAYAFCISCTVLKILIDTPLLRVASDHQSAAITPPAPPLQCRPTLKIKNE